MKNGERSCLNFWTPFNALYSTRKNTNITHSLYEEMYLQVFRSGNEEI